MQADVGLADATALTLSIWVRPRVLSGTQCIFAIGDTSSTTPVLRVELLSTGVLRLSNYNGTTNINATLHAGELAEVDRLIHILWSYNAGTGYWRVSSKGTVATGTSTGFYSPVAFSQCDKASIGCRHDSTTIQRATADIFQVCLLPEFVGDVRESEVYSRFETELGDWKWPGGKPLIHFDGDRHVGTIKDFTLTGDALPAVGLARKLSVTGGALNPFCTDGTEVYWGGGNWNGITAGQILANLNGFDPAGGNIRHAHCTASGAALILKNDGGLHRLYRFADPTDPQTAELETPVLLIGSDGTTGTNGSNHSTGIRNLGKSNFLNCTLDEDPCILFGEYNTTSQASLRVWISEDDGASWAPFWIVNEWNGTQHFRHIHGLAQNPDTGEILVCLGDAGNAAGLVKGPGNVKRWSAIDDTAPASIGDESGFACLYGQQHYRWIDAIYHNGFWYGHVDSADGVYLNSGIWQIAGDFSTEQRVYYPDYMDPTKPGFRAVVGGGGLKLASGMMIAMDYLVPVSALPEGVPDPQKIRIHGSIDGRFWAEIAYLEMKDTRTATRSMLNAFQTDTGAIYLGGNYNPDQVGSPNHPIVEEDGWFLRGDEPVRVNVE